MMNLAQTVALLCLAVEGLVAGWIGWRFFHLRDDRRWQSAGMSFGVALIFLLNAIVAASDMPLAMFRTVSLLSCGLSLFVCGLWLGIALFTRDQGRPAI